MRRWSFPVIALGLSAALLLPAPAHAQFGGLVKKAKKAVSGDPAPASSGGNGRASNTFGAELTPETFAAVMKGLNAELEPREQRDALARQRDDLVTARSKLLDAHAAELDAYQKAVEKNTECRDAAFDRIDKEHEAAMQRKQQEIMSTPGGAQKLQEDAMALSQQAAALMQKGDTAGVQRLQLAFAQKTLGLDPKADTAAVVRQCGPLPARAAWQVQADADFARADTLDKRISALEGQMNTRGLQASGMSSTQYNLARERIVNWYYGGPSHTSVQQFGKAELEMLNAHAEDIKRVARVL